MSAQVSYSHRLKRPVAHVQRDLRDPHAASFNFSQYARSKMQARCGSRDRASLARVNRLIPLAIFVAWILCALDIGRQGRLPNLVDDLIQGPGRFESDQAYTIIKRLDHKGLKL